MNNYAVDLHIHTALSPCAERDMTPRAVVRQASEAGLAMIAICDHNAAGNALAVREAAGDEMTVLAGIEITTTEEAHLLGIFAEPAQALAVADKVGRTLPLHTGMGGFMGEQSIFAGSVISREKRMLSAASGFSLFEAAKLIRANEGLAIAAHLDRPSFSVISQLGFIPDDVVFDAVEISAAAVAADRMKEFEALGYPLITSSDSHSLDEIGCCVAFLYAESPTFDELKLALRGLDGRRCFIA